MAKGDGQWKRRRKKEREKELKLIRGMALLHLMNSRYVKDSTTMHPDAR